MRKELFISVIDIIYITDESNVFRNKYPKELCRCYLDHSKTKIRKNWQMRRPGIEPGSTAWKAAMLTIIPPTLFSTYWKMQKQSNVSTTKFLNLINNTIQLETVRMELFFSVLDITSIIDESNVFRNSYPKELFWCYLDHSKTKFGKK